METLIEFITKAGPATIYLVALVWLFLYNERKSKAREDKYDALLAKYHEQVEEQIHTLTLINERLDK